MAKAPKTSTRNSPKTGGRDPEVQDAVIVSETKPESGKGNPAPESAADSTGDSNIVEVGGNDAKDDQSQPSPETEKSATTAVPPVKQAERKHSGAAGFFGVVLGGVVAAVVGFAAARYVVPEGWPFPGVTPEPDPLALAVEAQAAETVALSGRLDEIGESVEALRADTSVEVLQEALNARLAALDADIASMAERLAGFDTRLAAVERLAPEGSAAAQMAAEAYDRELAALREMFEGELARIEASQSDAETLKAQAADAARAAAGRAALARISAALDTGGGFEEALAELTGATGLTAPPGLADVAAEGVPTLAALQEAFPPAARVAIESTVRASVEAGEVSRFTAFLQTQLGTRSLEPIEGDDADAVLSRAEAALRSGDIGAALAELENLPEAGRPAFEAWRTMAETRQAALTAGASLAAELNAR